MHYQHKRVSSQLRKYGKLRARLNNNKKGGSRPWGQAVGSGRGVKSWGQLCGQAVGTTTTLKVPTYESYLVDFSKEKKTNLKFRLKQEKIQNAEIQTIILTVFRSKSKIIPLGTVNILKKKKKD